MGLLAAGLSAARGGAARLWGAAWEARRRAYAFGLRRPERVPARVVSLGNLTAGGTGKTTLALHLARRARERGLDPAVVCRRYRPGPGGRGDEELLLAAALGGRAVYAGRSKRALAARAAAEGRDPVLVDDGFSHWALARDLDVVLLDAGDPWGGGRLLPAGHLREPLRALARAQVVVVTRVGPDGDPGPVLAAAARLAPAARLATARHRVAGLRGLDGGPREASGRFRVVTATGNPAAVAASAREAGLEVCAVSAYRDHHWFRSGEAEREREHAARDGAAILLTTKDAVRWPATADRERVCVLDVEWEWLAGAGGLDDFLLGSGPA